MSNHPGALIRWLIATEVPVQASFHHYLIISHSDDLKFTVLNYAPKYFAETEFTSYLKYSFDEQVQVLQISL